MRTDGAIRDELRTFIGENFFAEGFGDEDSFLGSGIIDSLGVLQLVTLVETRYNVAVNDAEIVPENFDSIARLADYIERKRPA